MNVFIEETSLLASQELDGVLTVMLIVPWRRGLAKSRGRNSSLALATCTSIDVNGAANAISPLSKMGSAALRSVIAM
ncbi:hypothetical protein [Hyphomicrobium sp.]|uniref:hypothetical protein n=1 Tax=Hyphomicrobium sp. TaxID=82 RepID=UPI002D776C9C|nr:hypothetical protein [Hyphomicrobium sp.]HET6389257.1 hypothetical protein [Hyphomicrobium sp.]